MELEEIKNKYGNISLTFDSYFKYNFKYKRSYTIYFDDIPQQFDISATIYQGDGTEVSLNETINSLWDQGAYMSITIKQDEKIIVEYDEC